MLKPTWITTSTTTGLQPCDRNEGNLMIAQSSPNQCSEESEPVARENL